MFPSFNLDKSDKICLGDLLRTTDVLVLLVQLASETKS